MLKFFVDFYIGMMTPDIERRKAIVSGLITGFKIQLALLTTETNGYNHKLATYLRDSKDKPLSVVVSESPYGDLLKEEMFSNWDDVTTNGQFTGYLSNLGSGVVTTSKLFSDLRSYTKMSPEDALKATKRVTKALISFLEEVQADC